MAHEFEEQHHRRQIAFGSRPFERELGSRLLPAGTLFAQQRMRWQPDGVEEHLVELMRAGEVGDRFHRHTGRIHRDDELRQALLAFAARFAAYQGDHEMADMRAAGPDLLPVDHPIRAIAPCRGADRGEVRTRPRFAQTDAGEGFAARDLWHPAALQFLVSKPQQQWPALPVGNPVCADRRARSKQFLDHDIAFELAAFMPAVFLGPGHAEQPGLAQLFAELRVCLGPAIRTADRVALAMRGHQRAHLFAQVRRGPGPIDGFGNEGLHCSPLRRLSLQFGAAPQDPLHRATNFDSVMPRDESQICARRET